MIKKVIFSIFFVCFGMALAYGQSSAELKKQREKIDAEIAQIQRVLQNKLKEKALSQSEVSALSRQLTLREDKITTINRELQLINNQINTNTKEVAALEAELEKMRRDYEKMVLFAFRNKNAHNKMMFIFASKDFNQAFKRVKYLQQFTDARKIKVAEIEETQHQIKLRLAQLEQDKQVQAALLKEQQAERDVIARDRSQHQQQLNQIVKEERGFKTQLTQKQQERKRIEAALKNAIARELEIARRMEEERLRKLAEDEARRTGKTVEEAEKTVASEARTGSDLLNTTPEAKKLSADFRSNRGRLPWPVTRGNIVRNYGSVTYENNVRDFYDYIRIRTSDNAPVRAVFAGDVISVVRVGASWAVIVRHGEYFTLYSNLRTASVKRGQKVSTGATLGTADSDADEGFSYVDLTIYQGQSALNPSQWIARQ